MQAIFELQSEFVVHSGRQFGGLPMYDRKHEHDGEPLMSLHSEKGPHGEGKQGLTGCNSSITGAKMKYV